MGFVEIILSAYSIYIGFYLKAWHRKYSLALTFKT